MIKLTEGENCWRKTEVEKIRFLPSGREYYKVLRAAMIQAEHSVTILAWDLSERIEMLRCDEDKDGYPSHPAEFIFALLEEKPGLEINVLLWDYSMVYVAEREWLPLTKWRREEMPRLNFEVDNSLPVGASHHQKVVVVDESLAFCGGFDISAWRWDTIEHKAEDSRRENSAGELYQPFHDIQVMVEGAVVHDLADLCAMRWKRATGKSLKRVDNKPEESIWPDDVEPDLQNLSGALALTFARFAKHPEFRHIEQLYLDMIKAARKYIYIENQYLSSHLLVDALVERLREEDGPEVVIVLTRDTGGWIEEGTMGLLRERLLEILNENDLHGRFSSFYPHVMDSKGNESQVYVHAKLMLIDDQMVRIGSANLSNRSMKVDSEVDLYLATERTEMRSEIHKLLCRLIGIHFGANADQISTALSQGDSLRSTFQEYGDGRRNRLRPLEGKKISGLMRKLVDTQILDPDEPISPVSWMQETVEEIEDQGILRRWLPLAMKSTLAILMMAGLYYFFYTYWGNSVTKEDALQFVDNVRQSKAAIPILFMTFLLGGLIAVPINLLLVTSTLVMGPVAAFLCGLSGSLASAVLGFAIGHYAGKPLVRRLSGKKMNKLTCFASSRGVFPVAILRILPVAPFPVINLALGSSGLRFRTYMEGSVAGMLPGILGVVLLARQFESAILDPGPVTFLVFAAVLLLVVGSLLYVRNQFRR